MRPEQNNMMQNSWYLTSLHTVRFNAEFQGPHCMVLSCEWHHWLQKLIAARVLAASLAVDDIISGLMVG